MHKNIKPDLLRSLEWSKQATKIREVIDIESINKLEDDINKFVLESKKRQKGHVLPAIKQVNIDIDNYIYDIIIHN